MSAARASSPESSRACARDAHLEELRERLTIPDALLSRTDLADLGLGRRAVDAVFRALPAIVLPGFSRPYVRVADYLRLLEESSYDSDRIRHSVRSPVLPPTRETASLQARSGSLRPTRSQRGDLDGAS